MTSLYPIMGVMMGVTKAYGAGTDNGASANNKAASQSEAPIPEYFLGHWESPDKKVPDKKVPDKKEPNKKVPNNKVFVLTDLWMRKVLISETKAKPPIYETDEKVYENQLLNRLTWSTVTKAIVKFAYGKDINDIQAGKLSALLRDANGGKDKATLEVLTKEWPLTGAQGLISILSYWRCNKLSVYQGYMDSGGKWGVFPDKLRIQVPEGFKAELDKLLAPKPAPVVTEPVTPKKVEKKKVSKPAEPPKKKRSWKVF